MSEEITLHVDDELRARAERLAEERGIPVSDLLERYLRLGLQRDLQDVGDAGTRDRDAETEESSRANRLTPRIQELKKRLGRSAPPVEVDDETRRWIEAAAEKHA